MELIQYLLTRDLANSISMPGFSGMGKAGDGFPLGLSNPDERWSDNLKFPNLALPMSIKSSGTLCPGGEEIRSNIIFYRTGPTTTNFYQANDSLPSIGSLTDLPYGARFGTCAVRALPLREELKAGHLDCRAILSVVCRGQILAVLPVRSVDEFNSLLPDSVGVADA